MSKDSVKREEKEKLDWHQIYDNLQISQGMLEKDNCLVDKQSVLQKRALILAKEKIAKKNFDETLMVEFNIGNQKFALDLQQIKRVCQLTDLTPLPCTPKFIAGIINHHGHIVTIINLGTFFGFPNQLLKEKQIIILEDNSNMIAILAEDIIGVRYINNNELQTITSPLFKNFNFMNGITSEHIIVLNAKNLVSHNEFLIDETV